MGNSGSSSKSDSTLSRRISQRLRSMRRAEEQSLKLLFLGPGESGKSTVFKQMRFLYGAGFSREDRARMLPFIAEYLVSGAQALVEACRSLGVPLHSKEAEAAGDKVLGITDSLELTPEVAAAINALWADKGVREMWARRSQVQIQESWADFASSCKDFPKWGGPGYVPSLDEVLHVRVRTTGVIDEAFSINGTRFHMVDVGGQRSERRKWVNCFDGVSAVVFVASISDYDQKLYEDDSQNRLLESLAMFEEVVNNKAFGDAAVVLFLNKTDLLEDKLVSRKVPLNASGFFPSAPSGTDVDTAKAWFEKLFRARIHNPRDRTVHVHFTNACDTKMIDVVVKATMQSVLTNNLAIIGL
jgi:guanine nucleotide-binding protein G(i) subunit alpha